MGFSNWLRDRLRRLRRKRIELYTILDNEISSLDWNSTSRRDLFGKWLTLHCPHSVRLGYDEDQTPFYEITEVSVWMHNNCGLRYVYFDPMCGAFYANFADPNDAFHFRLRFAEARIDPPVRPAILDSYRRDLEGFEIVEKPC